MKKLTSFAISAVILVVLTSLVVAQKKNNKRPAARPKATPENTAPVTPASRDAEVSPVAAATPPKRNARPDNGHKDGSQGQIHKAGSPNYFYEFDRPGFTYNNVKIEHDEQGRGTISFSKEDSSEAITDPVELSAATMARLREIFDGLNFLDSTEIYQHERDFSNMGNVTITLKRDERSRTAKYNWTDNKLAKELMDEYRRISNEYTWRFEMALAIENQPLQIPSLMELMDRYISRGEISDPVHILPMLEQYSTNERLPLMARNRAAKIVKQIAKSTK